MAESQVFRRTVVVKADKGMHIRPCTAEAQLAKSILDLMTLATGPDTQLILEVDGEDAAEAIEHLTALFEAGLGTPSVTAPQH